MILQSMKYCRFQGERNEWAIEGRPINDEYGQELTFEQINLIVGMNASGKTNFISVIRQISDLISGEVKLSNLIYDTANYELHFKEGQDNIRYLLNFKEGRVIQETFEINGDEKLNRERQELYYEEIGKKLSYGREDTIVALSESDSKQQPFFESLHHWGKNLSHYKFGSTLGKDTLIKDINLIKEDQNISLKNSNDVTSIFIKGKLEFGDSFVTAIKDDMRLIGYAISDINANPLKFIPVSGFGLSVQEEELKDTTDQREMSQGMFRALSLIIQLNYSLMSKTPSCILIDDIGEGLDYERSTSLIDLIIKKSEQSSVQIIMTTNDRFVMNKIPIKYWTVIKRTSNKSLFYNYKNSKENFDDFSLTGLNNFEFFATDFFVDGFEEYVKDVK